MPASEPVKSPAERMVRGLTAGGRWIRTCMGLFLSRVVLGLSSLLCSERERAFFVPSPAIRVPGARGRGQGTETLAKLGGLPPSGACVWQRPLFKPGAGFDA